jgi:peptide/nickel transport system permease protein
VSISESPAEWLKHILLPAITLAAATSAELVRQMRAAMIEVLDQDYIRTARSKGLSEFRVVAGHGLKNALIPVATVAGLSVSRTFGLSVIVEQIFALNGVGSLALHAVFDRDIPLIQGIVLMAATVVLLTNLAVDLSYLYLNPATREA